MAAKQTPPRATAATLSELWDLARIVADHGEQPGFAGKVYCTWRQGRCTPHRPAGSDGPWEHRPDCPVARARALLDASSA